VDAATGEQEWAFTQPSDEVDSSPTVADGTVYVGSYDSNLYAVDAATGSQEWAFTQPSDEVFSSPTVADGTVYVGSGGFGDGDGTLYAVDAGVEGSSEGSRVNLGTPGDLSTGGGDSSGLIDRAGPAGLLVAAILTLGGYGYYRLRRSGDGQGQTSQRAGGRRD
jgi:outer membrane protein assembly factor BamB